MSQLALGLPSICHLPVEGDRSRLVGRISTRIEFSMNDSSDSRPSHDLLRRDAMMQGLNSQGKFRDRRVLLAIVSFGLAFDISISGSAAQEPELYFLPEHWSLEEQFHFADIVGGLHADDPARRCRAIYDLATPRYCKTALAELRYVLVADENEIVRRTTAHMFWSEPQTYHEGVLPDLERAMLDVSPAVRLRAVMALARHVSIVSDQVFYRGKEDDQKRLRRLDSVRTRLSNHSDPVVRGLMQLGWARYVPNDPIGPDIKHVLPLIFSALELERTSPLPVPVDELQISQTFQHLALFGVIGEAAESAVPLLMKELESLEDFPTSLINQGDPATDRCHAILTSLVNIGEPAVPQLLKGLDGRHEMVRRTSAMALAFIDRDTTAPVATLLESLKGPCWGYCAGTTPRRADVAALAALGTTGIPALFDQLRIDASIGANVRAVVSKLAPRPATVHVLIDELHDDSPTVRSLAALGLGHQGQEARIARSHLEELRDDKSQQVSEASRKALERINEALRRPKSSASPGSDDNN